MKHGQISDVHSGLPSLGAMLEDVDGRGDVGALERAVGGVFSSGLPGAFAGRSYAGGNPEPVEVS